MTTDDTTTAAPAATRTVLRAEGFSCPSCVSKIEKALRSLPGVTDATVHFASSRIEVNHDPSVTGVDELVHAVERAGYTARPSAF
ncbi:heavy-metal-associated domain-containing protein [Brachybacterium muris]|uniref:Copper chaperone CopZ n=1 Tax=Brachybacterium muris UCD-AY4 TaxID=1249481 RepID=A0A022L227_9MICO|nr:heavy metal-associated domain-containing protein [Brachybacterium muris]PZP13923.1 MAG: heavy-metal-associated domain-containing protein [Brachybacterium faecium]EYT50001.1 heavy metal transport/detoxification protein [Brachybacterium muris UCD-AY4]MBM7502228.1 copper chaperone CopZ [Brachybacterium muris]MCT1432114.1 heavy-metal-associated domain-containing protein [Brachybacterium muris]MCT1655669.1 heavy-metal-associated domain-containing protein [Brachybacterium muris]